MRNKTFLALAALLAVAGCSQEVPSIPQEQVAAPPPVGGFVDAGAGQPALSADAATFSMTPDAVRTCDADGHGIVSVARWEVATQRIQEVSIYVIAAKGEKKLWLSGGAKGEAATGDWVFPHSRFQLVDRKSGRTISEIAIQPLPCP